MVEKMRVALLIGVVVGVLSVMVSSILIRPIESTLTGS